MEGDCKRKLWVLSMVMKQRWEYWRSVILKPMEIDASTLPLLKSIRTCFVELQTKQVLMLIILNYSEKPLSFFLWTAPNSTFFSALSIAPLSSHQTFWWRRYHAYSWCPRHKVQCLFSIIYFLHKKVFCEKKSQSIIVRQNIRLNTWYVVIYENETFLIILQEVS